MQNTKTNEEEELLISIRKKVKHISHIDLDGYACTILTKQVLSYYNDMFLLETENITPGKLYSSIEQVLEAIDEYDLIIITDLGINQRIVDLINSSEHREKFKVFDHHEHVVESLPDNIVVELTNKDTGNMTSATEIYYNWLISDRIFAFPLLERCRDVYRYFVDCVNSYDTFMFWSNEDKSSADLEAGRLNTLFHILDRSEFMDYIAYILSFEDIGKGITYSRPSSDCSIWSWVEKIIDIEQSKNERYIDSSLKKMAITQLAGSKYKDGELHSLDYKIGVIFAYKNGPIIGNLACTNTDIDICVIITNNQVSFYSTAEDVDVSKIARLFNGGGHRHASGITIPYSDTYQINIEHFINMLECAGNIVYGTTSHNNITPPTEDWD